MRREKVKKKQNKMIVLTDIPLLLLYFLNNDKPDIP